MINYIWMFNFGRKLNIPWKKEKNKANKLFKYKSIITEKMKQKKRENTRENNDVEDNDKI